MKERLGVAPEVISGEEEAALSFAGATKDLPDSLAPFWWLILVVVQQNLLSDIVQ